MVFIPFKFLPAILLLGGIGLMTDHEPAVGVVMALIGAVWSYFMYLKPRISKQVP